MINLIDVEIPWYWILNFIVIGSFLVFIYWFKKRYYPHDSRLSKGIYYVTIDDVDEMFGNGYSYTHTIEDDTTTIKYKGYQKEFRWSWKGKKPSDVDGEMWPCWSLKHLGAQSEQEYAAELQFRINTINEWVKNIDKKSEEKTDNRWYAGRFYNRDVSSWEKQG